MPTYAFETITAEQALNISENDYLMFAAGPASQVSVLYTPERLPIPARIEVTFGGRTVVFGSELAGLSQRGALEMGDHSRLLIGDDGADVLTGYTGADGLYGGGGNDVLRGWDGDDLLQGNSGNDTLYGDAGSNVLYGGQGDDLINASVFGETKGSWAHGNKGDDEVIGGDGADTLYGGQGNDFLAGKDGDDFLSGDMGDDEIFTGSGDDLVFGGEGGDTITSSSGADSIYGGDGADQIVTYGYGRAHVDAGDGNDTIVSAGYDRTVILGGAGRDRFEFIANHGPRQGDDNIIADWNGAEDHIAFAEVGIAAILPRSYSEFVAGSYAQALSIADEHIAFTGAKYVAAQVGADVIVFADTNGESADGADIAIVLLGRTLDDVSLLNFG